MNGTDDKSYQPRRIKADDAGLTAAEERADPAEQNDASTGVNDDIRQLPPEDSFDYIVPGETYKEHSRHRRKRKKKPDKPSSTVRKDDTTSAYDGFVFATPRSRKRFGKRGYRRGGFRRMKLWKRILIVFLIVVLSLTAALAGTLFVLREIGRSSMKTDDDFSITLPDKDESGNDIIQVDNSGRVITYDGVSYELNDDLITVTVIGADEGTGEAASKRMSDVIGIFTLDPKTGKVKLLSISRDMMADIDVYSDQGEYIDTQRMQMAFAYSFANEKVSGGKNTNTALMRLFYGLPFENYFAINMDALITLNDAVGGVTLTSSMTFTSPEDGRTISEGETVTLHGKEADRYVRERDTSRLDSNNARMQRQQEYIRAFAQSILPAVKEDISVVSKLYSAISSNADSSLNLPKLTYVASVAALKLRSAADVEYVSLKGTITEGEFAELNVTDEDTIRTMLDVFYTPLATIPKSIQ